MNIAVIGLGYVGLTTALILSNAGNNVIGCEVDTNKVAMIAKRIMPFHEPLLEDMLNKVTFEVTTSIQYAVEKSDTILVCVGTPEKYDGRADLTYVMDAMKKIGEAILKGSKYKHIILKSTCVPGTSQKCINYIEMYCGLKHGLDFYFVYSPEFLREGTAVYDSLNPDKVVIGYRYPNELYHALTFYQSFLTQDKIENKAIATTYENAEMIKYVNNAFLATKISFINEIANICEKTPNADIKVVATAIGMDSRIGNKFLNAGLGYGGSCFPKDVSALICYADDIKADSAILNEVHATNISQRHWPIGKIRELFGYNIDFINIAVLGVAFKPNTDDTRESPAIDIIDILEDYNTHIKIYDPVVKSHNKITSKFCNSVEEALEGADCVIIATEWDEFKIIPPETFIRKMCRPIVLDGRRIYDPAMMKDGGVEYYGVGLNGKD